MSNVNIIKFREAEEIRKYTEMFLRNSIERILSDRDIKKKEHAQLKQACESALEQLNAEIERHTKQSTGGILPNLQEYILADNYFHPFELACQSKSPKIVVTALDCLQKLIAYGHLIGDSPDSANPDRLLIDRIVEAICFPFQGPHTDDIVQLQIIKAILAVVLSNTAKAHEGSLLLAVRTCFNIYLASRNQVNQSTAKGILTQTINSVFVTLQRQEQQDNNIELDLDEMVVKSVLDSVINQIVSTEHSVKEITVATEEPSSSGSITNGIGQNSPSTSTHHNHHPAGVASLSVESLVETLPNSIDEAGSKLEFKSTEEKDAFLIFRALCKLSMKHLPDAPDPKSHELRSKLLSLEMILLVLQNFNAPLSDKHSFIFAIRHFLCVALTQNAVSQIIAVFEKALAIFVQLVNKFRVHLKRQIEVFFKEIIISILKSPSSSFEHKWIVMHTISKIFDNYQSVVDIYINYDCHLTSPNILQVLVDELSKISKNNTTDTAPNNSVTVKEREKKMQVLALECLVKVYKALILFYEEMVFSKSELSTNEDQEENEINGALIAQQYEQLKQRKSIIEHGIDLFAQKPNKGIVFLQEKGIIGTEAADIAHFFHVEERLDKTAIGDYLGEGKDFNKEVMFAFIDQFDFSDVPYVQAIRKALEKFRLPGEAQKIDRIVEKFASRYIECNPTQELFASADTAYVLCFAIIMLTTDQHSSQVRHKMTKEQFMRNLAGCNDGGDLSPEFLSDIFEDIAANEIKVRGGLGAPKLNVDIGTVSYRQLKEFRNLELQTISQTAYALIEAASNCHFEFTFATHFEDVRPMAKAVWHVCFAAFSIGLQQSSDPEFWKLCLEGFRYGVRVACIYGPETAREAYVQSLTNFTLLVSKNSLSHMKAKNVECIKLLITIGVDDGNFLGENWYDVLKCISQLELAQLIGASQNGHSQHLRNVFNIDDKAIHTLQECLGETSSQSVVVAVDRIFQGSSKLDGDAIQHFVRALCRVSLEELSLSSTPRMYMLQKIVEISFYNMNRIRIEWSRIWSVLGEHFNVAGCSDNPNVSHFALDALRQLSTKFLEKGELPNFRLQKEFLRPFEIIMENNTSYDCRDMTIACVTNMVQSHSSRIRSGWKNIFIVFTVAATETNEGIAEKAFTTTSDIISNIFPKQFGEVMDSFPEAIKCLSEFACNNHFPDICMEAIRLIRFSAELVRKNTDLFDYEPEAVTTTGSENITSPSSPIGSPLHHLSNTSPQHTISDNHRVWAKGWLSIFIQLWSVISRCTLDVRTRSLTVLFEIIKTYGKDFKPAWWKDIFKIIFKIFKFSSSLSGKERKAWMQTTCNHTLFAISDVFSAHYQQLAPHLPDFYEQLFLCIQKGSSDLAKASIDVLENVVVSNGEHFTPEVWDRTIELIVRIFDCSVPEFPNQDTQFPMDMNNGEIVESGKNSPIQNGVSGGHQHNINGDEDDDSVAISSITRCIVQLEVVDAVTGILFGKNAFKVEGPNPSNDSNEGRMFAYVSPEHLSTLTEQLLASHKLARNYNSNTTQRAILWKAAFKGTSKPNLIKHETHTMHGALNILFHLYADEKLSSKDAEKFRPWLVSTIESALEDYVSIRSEHHRSQWLAVIQMLLNRTFELSNEKFQAMGIEFFLKLANLIETEEPQIIRTALKRVITRSIQQTSL